MVKNPDQKQIIELRKSVQAKKNIGITAARDLCAKMLHTSRRAWQQWEAGDRKMHPAFWELASIKLKGPAPVSTAAVAAIQFALGTDEGITFLRCWNEGDFNAISKEWHEAPEEVFVGADPLHPKTKVILNIGH
jgi:hypothetical protein